MARPRRIAGALETPELILQAARLEFAARGFACRLEDIAARCGIQRASLLHHFPSKQALIDVLMEQLVSAARVRLVAAAAETRGNYAATIRRVTEELRQLEREEQGVAAVLLQALLTEPHPGLSRQLQDMLALVQELALQAGAGAVRPAAEVRAAIAHVIMGELSRLALGAQAQALWGEGDAVWALMQGFFLDTPVKTEP